MTVARLEREISMPEFVRWLAFWEVRAMKQEQKRNRQAAVRQVAPTVTRRLRRGRH